MRIKLWTLLVPLTLVAAPVFSDSALDRYFSLRRESQADKLQVSQIQTSPDIYVNRTFELRGTVSGSATIGDSVSMIIETADGTFIVRSDQDPNISSGSRICAIVRVGDKCTLSLTDLRLAAFAYQSDVAARERKAAEAMLAAREKTRKKTEVATRTKRVQKNVSRGQVYSADALVATYKNAIKGFNRRLSDSQADTIARSILGFSAKYRVDPRLVVAVILAESNFKINATSHSGAMGLGQLMPGTAAGLGVSNAYDPVENIAGSVRLIKGHLERQSGSSDWNDHTWRDLSLALASYNAGPGAVRKYGGIPPYRETQNYVKKVCSIYKQLCGE